MGVSVSNTPFVTIYFKPVENISEWQHIKRSSYSGYNMTVRNSAWTRKLPLFHIVHTDSGAQPHLYSTSSIYCRD